MDDRADTSQPLSRPGRTSDSRKRSTVGKWENHDQCFAEPPEADASTGVIEPVRLVGERQDADA